MGSQRTKEEDVEKISTSVFITNFPDSFSAKELFKTCSQYGNVVDSYIPNKRFKTGKRFGFVRFHKVVTVERLKFEENRTNLNENNNVKRVNDFAKSFSNIVKGGTQYMKGECSQPALVLDDTCFRNQDFSLSLISKLKVFGSLPNLKKILEEEGFSDINIRYKGGFWVMFQFLTKAARESFKSHVGVNYWFSVIQPVSDSFRTEEMVAWIDIEGVPLRVWSHNTFSKICSKWGSLLFEEFVDDPYFHRKRLCIKTSTNENIFYSLKIIVKVKSKDGFSDNDNEADENPEAEEVVEPGEIKSSATKDSKKDDLEATHSEDPFSIYDILEKQQSKMNVTSQPEVEPKYPPGFAPNNSLDIKSPGNQVHGTLEKEHGVKDDFKEEASYSISSVQSLAQKTKKDSIKELCFKNKVNFLSLQETKMEKVDLIDIKSCWGNLTFDYVVGPSVGNSGGILCVWDYNMFHKENHTISDYFIAIMGKWLPSDKNLLIISVYAPQELSEKKLLWQYLVHVIEGWNCDVIVMGDFNEVRNAYERFCCIFNVRGAAAFNSFISTGGLVEIPSGGYSYTWAYKSAAKMSKLDRFFVPEDLMKINVHDSNDMLKLTKKLKILKGLIRSWVKDKKDKASILKYNLKKIADIDSLLNNGKVSSLALEDRSNVMNILINLEKNETIEVAQ
nr:RNA-directed DNA polymerase, eukaryota [Tanacetum cinerariifolium]